MDALTLPDARYTRVLAHLARVNIVTLAMRPTLRFISAVMAARPSCAGPLRLLDVGFGYGDMLRAIAALAARKGWAVELVGVDLNPRSAQAAGAAPAPLRPIRWITGDYQSLAAARTGEPWDVIISSLVTHHMSAPQRRDFLTFMEQEAQAGWFVNDLHRHRFPFLGYPLLATLLLVDPIVRRDGQLSIARSFRAAEWRAMLADAAIAEAGAGRGGAAVKRWFPWRLCVERHR